jgi:hypothetical protein
MKAKLILGIVSVIPYRPTVWDWLKRHCCTTALKRTKARGSIAWFQEKTICSQVKNKNSTTNHVSF